MIAHLSPKETISNYLTIDSSLLSGGGGWVGGGGVRYRGFPTRMVYVYNDYIVEIHHSGREPLII